PGLGRSRRRRSAPVKLDGFAMGVYEVTFDDYDRFAEATKRNKPSDAGWGRGSRPVINVSWEGANAYAAWLSEQTGHEYRLPTEAEWEYAARAGTETRYWWGNEIGENQANCAGNQCSEKWQNTAPVGSFKANAFGLYDTAGNVWEWTCSTYTTTYVGDEVRCADYGADGLIAVRGGSWDLSGSYLRSALRSSDVRDRRLSLIGFRFARVQGEPQAQAR
ncbi:MAG: SUMF1/EgtB/PvdO family nonheme iron enzyme, partial [Pseudomonadota bacterium]